jgi:hypothetical protein
MKRMAVTLLAIAVWLIGCGKKDPAPVPPATNQPISGNPITAPVDYLGAVNQAQKHAVKVVDTVQVQQAVQQFHAAEDRYPRDLAELVKEGYLPKIPPLPAGMKYQYNPTTGQIKAVPAR